MSRIVKRDFKELLEYLEAFNIKKLLGESLYKEQISISHKKYFSFLVLTTELDNTILGKDYLFLKETGSDLLSCLFHLSTGSYKSSKLILRSSIECFLKAFTLSWIPDIDKEKSVYEIFDKIKQLPYFRSEIQKSEFKNIHSIYKTLCKDVHVAEKVNMANVNSLDFFPVFSKKQLKEITLLIIKLIPSYCFLICDKYNQKFHKIHHSHKEVILDSINRQLRPTIMNTSD